VLDPGETVEAGRGWRCHHPLAVAP